jgi:hypothetical protein
MKITLDTYGHPRQGTGIALADRLDHLARDTVRYAPSVPLDDVGERKFLR